MSGRHASDCAVHSEPAYPAGPCDCHLSIESRLDEMITHAYQGSTDAADEIRQELVERYKAMQPATWVGLTDEEFEAVLPYCHSEFDLQEYKDFARDIEAKLREKNGGGV